MPDGVEAPHDLSAHELRVLGCLIEKEATTPDAYPLTVNSLRNACNQSTSREPVVAYTEPEIEQALTALRARGLTRTVHSTSNRAIKYRHVLSEALALEPGELAVVSVLMLRGAQTVGELKTRTERQHRFDATEEVGAVLAGLAGRDDPLVQRLERQPGQKDARWVQLLSPVELSAAVPAEPGAERVGRRADASSDSEFADLFGDDLLDELTLVLLEVLDDIDLSYGPIVDIGTGTGARLAALSSVAPGARVLAIEPSPTRRAALYGRLVGTPELGSAITVLPFRLAEAPLPAGAAALVVATALGRLSDVERVQLWSFIAERMPASAPAVIGVAPPRQATMPLTRLAWTRLGDHVYERWCASEPVGEATTTWTEVDKVIGPDGTTLAEYTRASTWRSDDAAGLRREIAAFGLSLSEHDRFVVVRRMGS